MPSIKLLPLTRSKVVYKSSKIVDKNEEEHVIEGRKYLNPEKMPIRQLALQSIRLISSMETATYAGKPLTVRPLKLCFLFF